MIVDAGDAPVETGDPVVVLGVGDTGPGAEEGGSWAGTINYEIVTRIGPRVDRVAQGASAGAHTRGGTGASAHDARGHRPADARGRGQGGDGGPRRGRRPGRARR